MSTTPLTNGDANAVIIGTPVYSVGNNTFDLAQANSQPLATVIGLVQDTSIAASASGNVQTDDTFTATTAQWDAITGASGGLTPGAVYYLHPTVAGRITATAPTATGQFVAKIGVALSTTILEIQLAPSVLLAAVVTLAGNLVGPTGPSGPTGPAGTYTLSQVLALGNDGGASPIAGISELAVASGGIISNDAMTINADGSMGVGASEDPGSMAVASGSTATYSSIAIGSGASASDSSLAMGTGAVATIVSKAIGNSSNADDHSEAIGESTVAGVYSIVIGKTAQATNDAIAVGGVNAMWLPTGKPNLANFDHSDYGQAAPPWQWALGASGPVGLPGVGNAAAAANSAVACGNGAAASEGGVTLGNTAVAGINSVAMGVEATADTYSVAIGKSATATNQSVAVGNPYQPPTVFGPPMDNRPTDSTTYIYSMPGVVAAGDSTAIGPVNASGASVVISPSPMTSGVNATYIGTAGGLSSQTGDRSVTLGISIGSTAGDDNTMIGASTYCIGDFNLFIGAYSAVNGSYNVVLGITGTVGTYNGDGRATAVSQHAGNYSTAFGGTGVQLNGDNTMATTAQAVAFTDSFMVYGHGFSYLWGDITRGTASGAISIQGQVGEVLLNSGTSETIALCGNASGYDSVALGCVVRSDKMISLSSPASASTHLRDTTWLVGTAAAPFEADLNGSFRKMLVLSGAISIGSDSNGYESYFNHVQLSTPGLLLPVSHPAGQTWAGTAVPMPVAAGSAALLIAKPTMASGDLWVDTTAGGHDNALKLW